MTLTSRHRMPLSELQLLPPTQQQSMTAMSLLEELEFKQPVERLKRIWTAMGFV